MHRVSDAKHSKLHESMYVFLEETVAKIHPDVDVAIMDACRAASEGGPACASAVVVDMVKLKKYVQVRPLWIQGGQPNINEVITPLKNVVLGVEGRAAQESVEQLVQNKYEELLLVDLTSCDLRSIDNVRTCMTDLEGKPLNEKVKGTFMKVLTHAGTIFACAPVDRQARFLRRRSQRFMAACAWLHR